MLGVTFSGSSSGSSGVAPVSPSVINNFPSFSNLIGGMQDSGVSAASLTALAVILLPAASTRNRIQPSAANVIPLTTKGFAGQSVSLFEAHTSAGVVVASISPTGLGTFAGGLAAAATVIIGTSDVVQLSAQGFTGQSSNIFAALNASAAVVASINMAGVGTFVGGVTTAKTTIAGIADAIQLSVTPNGTQTNPTVKWFTSTAGKDLQFSNTGGIIQNAVSDAGSNPESIYSASRTYTGNGGMLAGAMRVVVTQTPSSNFTTLRTTAIYGAIIKSGSSNAGSASPSYLIGVCGEVNVSGSGTLFRMIGLAGSIVAAGGGTITHTIGILSSLGANSGTTYTNIYGVLVATTTLNLVTFDATPTNLYGMYIEPISNGLTLNYAIFTNSGLVHFGDSLDLASGKSITMLAGNIVTDTTTGTKIGTATSQKLGFWNATPIVQPAGATQAAPAAYATGVFGLDSDANMHALYDLVVAIRTALVNSGIMKGAA